MVYVLIRLIFLSKTIVSSMNLNRIFQTFYPNNRITWYTFTAEISARVCQLYKIGDQFLIDTVNEGLRGMHKIGIFMYYKFTIVAALVGAHPEIWSQGGLNVKFITKTHNSHKKFCFSSLSTLEFDDIQIFQLPRIFTINGISFYKLVLYRFFTNSGMLFQMYTSYPIKTYLFEFIDAPFSFKRDHKTIQLLSKTYLRTISQILHICKKPVRTELLCKFSIFCLIFHRY